MDILAASREQREFRTEGQLVHYAAADVEDTSGVVSILRQLILGIVVKSRGRRRKQRRKLALRSQRCEGENLKFGTDDGILLSKFEVYLLTER